MTSQRSEISETEFNFRLHVKYQFDGKSPDGKPHVYSCLGFTASGETLMDALRELRRKLRNHSETFA